MVTCHIDVVFLISFHFTNPWRLDWVPRDPPMHQNAWNAAWSFPSDLTCVICFVRRLSRPTWSFSTTWALSGSSQTPSRSSRTVSLLYPALGPPRHPPRLRSRVSASPATSSAAFSVDTSQRPPRSPRLVISSTSCPCAKSPRYLARQFHRANYSSCKLICNTISKWVAPVQRKATVPS